MTINKIQNGDSLLIEVSGSIDSTTAGALEEVVKNDTKGINYLEISLKDVNYVSSAGLRVLLLAEKTMADGSFVVSNVNEEVMNILTLVGFDSVLTIK